MILSREQLAALWGVSCHLIDRWVSDGMPSVAARGGAVQEAPDWLITRRELAGVLGLHPETVTKRLREGLAGALVEAGGRGKEAVFDLRLAFRWKLATEGRLNALVLEDFEACARAKVIALSQLSLASALADVTTDRRTR